MEKLLRELTLLSSNVDRRHVQMVFVLVTMGLLVVGAAAPAIGGSNLPGTGN
jgi:hypothetical protein